MQKVSIVIPTFNRASLLVEALHSVKNQTFQNIEVVIVDDASTDDTKERVKAFKGLEISYHLLDKNIGYINARNKGIELAKGDFISFLDSDDRILPQKIEKLVIKAKQENANLVYAGWRWMNFESKQIRIERLPAFDGKINELPRWCFNVVPDLVNTSMMKALKFDARARNNENTEFLIRVFKKFHITFIPEILSEYRDHQGIRASDNLKGMLKGLEFIIDNHFEFIKAQNKWLSEKYLSMAIMIRKTNGSLLKLHRYHFYSIKFRPFHLRYWIHWLYTVLKLK